MAQWTMRLLEARDTERMVGKLVEADTPPMGEAAELLALMRQLCQRGQPSRTT